MKTFLAVSFAFLLSFSLVLGASIISQGVDNSFTNYFSVSAVDDSIIISSSINTGETFVFVDDIFQESFDSFSAGETKSIKLSSGLHDVQVRFLVDEHFVWENYKIIEDDVPLYIKYVDYDKDDEKIKFILTGASALHPDDLNSTKESLGASFDSYSVVLNDEHNLFCYTKITSGKVIPFSCNADFYPEHLVIDVTLGILESFSVDIIESGDTLSKIPSEEKTDDGTKEEMVVEVKSSDDLDKLVSSTKLPTSDIVDDSPEKNISTYDGIVLEDKIPLQKETSQAVTWLIFLLFLFVIVIMFIASRHKVHRTPKQKKKVIKATNNEFANNKR